MPDPKPADKRLTVRREAVVWREVDGETVVLDLESARYLGINETGSLLWEALAGGATPGQLAELLVGRFAVDRTRAEADVDTFLRDCRSRGLVR